MKRHASAIWLGSLKKGSGSITSQSKVLSGTPYSFGTRFENGKRGTNPEELIAAAHSGCFTMQLSAYITEAGYEISQLETLCNVEFRDGEVVHSHLAVKGKVFDISKENFQKLVTKAEKNCPISKLLNCMITSEAFLVNL